MELSGSDVALILGGIATVISAIASSVAVVIGALNARAIENVRHSTDGMKDELVRATAMSSRAEGMTAGAMQERVDVADRKVISDAGKVDAAKQGVVLQSDTLELVRERAEPPPSDKRESGP